MWDTIEVFQQTYKYMICQGCCPRGALSSALALRSAITYAKICASPPGRRLRLSSFQPLINHYILPPAISINKNKMKKKKKKVIHYDGKQNTFNKTNKRREWKLTVILWTAIDSLASVSV